MDRGAPPRGKEGRDEQKEGKHPDQPQREERRTTKEEALRCDSPKAPSSKAGEGRGGGGEGAQAAGFSSALGDVVEHVVDALGAAEVVGLLLGGLGVELGDLVGLFGGVAEGAAFGEEGVEVVGGEGGEPGEEGVGFGVGVVDVERRGGVGQEVAGGEVDGEDLGVGREFVGLFLFVALVVFELGRDEGDGLGQEGGDERLERDGQ
mmetsp:Transcript_692/g.1965  ORF Transcript_692/g.1965 Transcript_692/m.1965 type:complete len:206 (-) Transcript_692:1151-1768(-)